ncbi:assimilatory sulfite reductase (NADPH) flavoprotein subunit [Saccharibacillus sp. CPCC 101409]|uniref:assimilatory sulfite reductase (NADPH) flavoprotein subunit n=1 Tax=Saccharibacillus sp. CPCC 101409 TaxID=3058041 RepID=UPI002670FA14|nr:assimilatory sulfite reductase (NADPH) flavoprotein subunit [Saccharibacillus sp. CPCC 101409]MDO3412541.1 assimilatory sulfite reductase (NADPH) flavoprotein subunit [Saccharibacillus sp. CPCC 101409]
MELNATNSPFNEQQTELLNRLLPGLNGYQRVWLSGYLSALPASETAQGSGISASAGSAPAAEPAPASVPGASAAAAVQSEAPREATVLFGSQTGNGSGLAKKLAKRLEDLNVKADVLSMADFKPNNLKKLQNLLIVVSTHGEGDPPDNAIAFHEFLHGKRAPKLDGLRYSVLALGDTSYEFFCQTGKDFDKRLEELGASRFADRADCDVDFDETAGEWMAAVTEALSGSAGASQPASEDSAPLSADPVSDYSRSNPFRAEVLENLNLNGRGSARETRHLELSLEGSGLTYEPGDSLGVYPENHPRLVDEIIAEMDWNPDEIVPTGKYDSAALREALHYYYEITVLTKPLLEHAAKLVGSEELAALTAPDSAEKLRAYLGDHDLLDLLRDYGFKGRSAIEVTGILRKLPPRLYSIASSPQATPDEVHLTVRTVRYACGGRDRYGVCSVQMAERLEPGDSLPVFVQHNPNFKLPENPDTPIIMIGPGTGVAPFRSFLAEREETGAEGKSWLFFGDQHFSTDFLYQTEWQRWIKDGVLTKMDVAFSRDTEEKVYVQHRMLEKSKELYEWIANGAALYVCGDEKNMAHDVHLALETILAQEGGLSPEDASEYVLNLQREKRYQRDVY